MLMKRLNIFGILSAGLAMAVMHMTDAVGGAVAQVGTVEGVGGASATPVELPALTEAHENLLTRITTLLRHGIIDVENFLTGGVVQLEAYVKDRLATEEEVAGNVDPNATVALNGTTDTAADEAGNDAPADETPEAVASVTATDEQEKSAA